jgi:hypothetical protein
MTLLQARADYVTALQTVSGLHVYTHGGTFDLAQLKAYARQAPAAILSLLRFDTVRIGGYPVATAHWGVIVMARDTPGAKRAEAVIDLAERVVSAVLPVFAGQSTSGAVARSGKTIESRNLFSAPLDAEGIAMWGLEWTQGLDLVQTDTSVDLSTLHLAWDLHTPDGTIEAEDDLTHLEV